MLKGERSRKYDLVIPATGFSNMVESVRQIFGDDIASRCKSIWGMDEEGELNSAWEFSGMQNLWLIVGPLQHSRTIRKCWLFGSRQFLRGLPVSRM